MRSHNNRRRPTAHTRTHTIGSYEGQFADGREHGAGRWMERKFAEDGGGGDGEAGTQTLRCLGFTGHFQEGEACGPGRELYADGSLYVGHYRGGKRHGPGMEISIVEECGSVGQTGEPTAGVDTAQLLGEDGGGPMAVEGVRPSPNTSPVDEDGDGDEGGASESEFESEDGEDGDQGTCVSQQSKQSRTSAGTGTPKSSKNRSSKTRTSKTSSKKRRRSSKSRNTRTTIALFECEYKNGKFCSEKDSILTTFPDGCILEGEFLCENAWHA